MTEQVFPIAFDKCPSCGCEDTITRLAAKGSKDIPEGTFVSAEQTRAFMVSSSLPKGLTVGVLMIHKDFCAGCGRQYVTKAEFLSIPTNQYLQMIGALQMPPLQQRRGNGPAGLSFLHG